MIPPKSAKPDWDDIESDVMLRMLEARRRRRSDYERDDVASEAWARGTEWPSAEGPAATPTEAVERSSMKPRWHILSDYERDDIDSANQIEGVRSVRMPYEALLEADLSRIVAEINGNVIQLPTKPNFPSR